MPYSAQREQKILEVLQQKGSVSIQELAILLSVSPMTVHRDLNRLAAAGKVEKIHGGAMFPPSTAKGGCAVCGKAISERTLFVISLENGERKTACCAHCGLMLHHQAGGVPLTADFLHNHMLSAPQAAYLIQSDLTVCCAPSVLSFGSRQEAEKFQRGFGGNLADFKQAVEFLISGIHDGG